MKTEKAIDIGENPQPIAALIPPKINISEEGGHLCVSTIIQFVFEFKV